MVSNKVKGNLPGDQRRNTECVAMLADKTSETAWLLWPADKHVFLHTTLQACALVGNSVNMAQYKQRSDFQFRYFVFI